MPATSARSKAVVASPGHDGNARANKCKLGILAGLIWQKGGTPYTATANSQVFTPLLIVNI